MMTKSIWLYMIMEMDNLKLKKENSIYYYGVELVKIEEVRILEKVAH